MWRNTIQNIAYVVLFNDILQVKPFIILKSEFFWDVTQHMLLIPYLRFGRNYRPHLQGGCPEKLLSNYRHTLCNVPEDCRSHLLRGGSSKSRIYNFVCSVFSAAKGEQIRSIMCFSIVQTKTKLGRLENNISGVCCTPYHCMYVINFRLLCAMHMCTLWNNK